MIALMCCSQCVFLFWCLYVYWFISTYFACFWKWMCM